MYVVLVQRKNNSKESQKFFVLVWVFLVFFFFTLCCEQKQSPGRLVKNFSKLCTSYVFPKLSQLSIFLVLIYSINLCINLL